MNEAAVTESATTAFSTAKLDSLMADAHLDWILASSKHNVQFLLGGYRPVLMANFDAIGVSRYLPVVGYARGRPSEAFYIGEPNERYGLEVLPVWVPDVKLVQISSLSSASSAADSLQERGLPGGVRIGVEPPFMPQDAAKALEQRFPEAEFADATLLLEELRAVKSDRELELVRHSSEGIADAMLAVFRTARQGDDKYELVRRYAGEVVARGLTYEYCLIAIGRSLNRAPSSQRWGIDEVLSLDSGGHLQGYVGDLCRMAIMGRPNQRLRAALSEVEAVQMATRRAITAGVLGKDVVTAGRQTIDECSHGKSMKYLVHGMGLLAHEAPHLIESKVVPYPPLHADRPLEQGMVLSIETEIASTEMGFVKLEDTVIVTADGAEGVGDRGRGWNGAGL